MRFPIFLVTAWYAWLHGVAEAADCVGVANLGSYKEEILLEDPALTAGLAVDWKNNVVYVNKDYTDTRHEVGVWDVDKRFYSVFSELPEYCRLAVDQRYGRVYAGCHNINGQGGLYIYDRHPRRFVKLTEQNDYIEGLHFAEQLYYTTYPEYKLRSYAHGLVQSLPKLQNTKIWYFVIDGNGNLVYSYDGSVSHQKMGTTRAVNVTTEKTIDGLAVGPRGDVYGSCRKEGCIYRIDTASSTASKVLDTVDECHSLAIDKDNNFLCFKDKNSRRIVRYVRCPT